MKRSFILAVCVVLLLIIPLPTLAEPDVKNRARQFVELLDQGKFDQATEFFDDQMAKVLPSTELADMWGAIVAQFGEYMGITEMKVVNVNCYKNVAVTCEFTNYYYDMTLTFDKEEKIAGLHFFTSPKSKVKYAPPGYVDLDSFTEMECVIGEYELPATLSIPEGEGPFSAVVLVHGSGPHDRDETIGPNKVFKDVAWGLATRGVAVLRYEKRTKECGNMIDIKNFTVNEETVDDALAAVELLYETPKIDRGRIFVLGHSLGGLMAPRIAALSSYHIAGLVLCAAPSDGDLLATMLRQTEYIASLDGNVNEKEAKQIRVIEDALKKLEDPKVPEDEIIIGCSKEYWLDLKECDPIKTAQSLQIPMLILQGGHDYQVTLEDFSEWKKGLPTQTFKQYPELIHLFIQGPPTPAAYATAGHVAEVVVDDIADWILSAHAPLYPS